MRDWLLKTKNISRDAFFWNAFSAIMNSFQTMVLLLVVTNTGTDSDSAWFVMAYAVGNLMLHVGKYGVRQFQVTDTDERYSFREYRLARVVSMVLMAGSTAAFLLYGMIFRDYPAGKTAAILLVTLLKGIEAWEDVYHGRMQQKGRLDTAGRILGIRLFLFLLLFSGLFLITKRLVLTLLVSVTAEALLSFIMNRSVIGAFRDEKEKRELSRVKQGAVGILRDCFPLAVSMCLNMYIANAPKYTIDAVVSDDTQTAFNVVFMPVFVIALMANFIYQPVLKKMGELWNGGKTDIFRSRVRKLFLMTVLLDLVLTAVGGLIGIPVLELIYGVSLSEFRGILILFLLAGGVIALQNLMILVITTLRMQKYMIFGYAGTALIYFFTDSLVLGQDRFFRLVLYYEILMAVLLGYCILLYIKGLKRSGRQSD